ncbi:CHAD domain-containing protein [Roseibium sp.]|uniref:CYTH and CHAD domain-containing protein n=1 Tax=Roseibium sp. TaxID=1936156 RepID=UPI003A98162C
MSKSPKEIELKLEVSPDVLDQLKRGGALQRFAGGRAVTKPLLSIYFDTPDQALRKAKISLRVRKVGRSWVQTAKLGTGVRGGLSSAVEAEHPVRGRAIDFSVIEDAGVLKTLTDVIGDKPLTECFETDIRRTTRLLTSKEDGSEIEVAFDLGEVKAGERTQTLAEVEFELKTGSGARLLEAAREIVGAAPFRLSPWSKAERGFRLAEGAAETGIRPKSAGDIALPPDETVELAFREILRSCLTQIADNRVAILESDDPEGPHQFRIGLRRLRSAFRLFKPVLNPQTLKDLDAQARVLATEAGKVRDLDVLTDEIVSPLAKVAPQGIGLEPLLEHLRTIREESRAALHAHLSAPDVNAFLFDLAAYTEGRGWLDIDNFDQTARLAQTIRVYSRKALDKQWKKVSSYGSRIDDLTIPERHEMRKALKKLRYGVEFFGSLYPKSDLKPFLKRMKRLQDIFGYLNDVAMAEKLAALPDIDGKSSRQVLLAIGFVIGWHEAQSSGTWPHAKGYWQDTKKVPKFWL